MKKYLKRIVVAVIALVYLAMLISAIIVNVKYHKILEVTELDISQVYDNEKAGVRAKIDSYKIVTPEELVSMYPSTSDIISDMELENIVLLYADVDIYDKELYKSATKGWTLVWSIEADNGWSHNTTLDLYKALNSSTEAKEHKYIFPYVISEQYVTQRNLNSPTEWKYKVQINKTPLVYFKLN